MNDKPAQQSKLKSKLFVRNIYYKYFIKLSLLSSLAYGICETYFHQVQCQSNSSLLRKEFIQNVCIYGNHSNHRMITSTINFINHIDDGNQLTYSYYPMILILLFAQVILSKISNEWFEYEQHLKLLQLMKIKHFLEQQSMEQIKRMKRSDKKLRRQVKQILRKSIEFLLKDSVGNRVFVKDFVKSILLSFISLSAQIWMLNSYLDGHYLSLGWKFILYLIGYNRNPLSVIFPLIIECQFNYYGASGSLTYTDHLCILNLNFINQYICLCGWFIHLLIFICLTYSLMNILLLILKFNLKGSSFQSLINDLDENLSNLPYSNEITTSTMILIQQNQLNLKELLQIIDSSSL